MKSEVGRSIYPIFWFLLVHVFTVKIFPCWVFASGSICYWDCLVWVLLPKCFYYFRMQDLEKSVLLPALKFLMADETNLVLPCFDTMAGFCFWAVFFLPCDKFHQFLLVFLISGKNNAVCSCWVETSILIAQFPRIHFSLILLKLFQWLGGHCPLSMTHSLQDTQPRQICLSWVFWAWCWRRDSQRPQKGKREFPGKAEAWCWRRKTYWLPKWNRPEPEGKAACSKKRMWPLLKEE